MTVVTPVPTTRSMHVFHGQYFAVKPEWQNQLEAIGLISARDWRRLSSEQTVSSSYNTTNAFRFQLNNKEQVFFKRYVYRTPRLKHWLQPSKAAVEAAGLHDLNKLDIPTIEVIAYGEKRFLGVLKAAFIVTRGLPDVLGLDIYMAQHWYKMDVGQKIKIYYDLRTQLIPQLQRTHHNGFFHWDLKLRNLLVQNFKAQPKLFWIDCPRSRRRQADNFDGVVTDFIAMARVGYRVLTPGQQMRFLLDYTNNSRSQARRIYRAIAEEFEKRPPRPLWHLLERNDPLCIAEQQKAKP